MTISICNTKTLTGIAIYCTQTREIYIAALKICYRVIYCINNH